MIIRIGIASQVDRSLLLPLPAAMLLLTAGLRLTAQSERSAENEVIHHNITPNLTASTALKICADLGGSDSTTELG
jgi:hypothetical protein